MTMHSFPRLNEVLRLRWSVVVLMHTLRCWSSILICILMFMRWMRWWLLDTNGLFVIRLFIWLVVSCLIRWSIFIFFLFWCALSCLWRRFFYCFIFYSCFIILIIFQMRNLLVCVIGLITAFININCFFCFLINFSKYTLWFYQWL